MDSIRNLVERFCAFENLWDACEREVRAHVEASRLAGIREAIAIIESTYLLIPRERLIVANRIRALLPPPSDGEKAKCTCRKLFDGSPDLPYVDGCPVHAPKPAAEKA